MTLDQIKEPISEELPAGEDLFESDDQAYAEYYFDAVGRLPEADDYFRRGMDVGDRVIDDVLFDSKTVNLEAELEAIDKLLTRTKDIRLLVLRASWAILAGDLKQSVESVEALTLLLETLPNETYPQVNESPRDRVDAINDLSQVGAMILPLRYLDLAGSGTSLRKMLVAAGEFTPHIGEHDIIQDDLMSQLAAAGDNLIEVHSQIETFLSCIKRIETACLSHNTPHTPKFNSLRLELDKIRQLLTKANTSLKSNQAIEDSKADPASTIVKTTGSPVGDKKQTTKIKSHSEAQERLLAIEAYFGHFEPSSAALLLVTQSRLLIGKSLIDAFDLLMPNSTDNAVVNFTPEMGFTLARHQLRHLADQREIRQEFIAQVPESSPTPSTETQEQERIEPEEAMVTHEQESELEEELDTKSEEDTVADSENPDDAEVDHSSDEDQGDSANTETKPEPQSSNVLTEHEGNTPSITAQPDAILPIRNAAEATAEIQAVENYFSTVEPSSPIPLLLARARSYIGKNFEALMRELIQT